MRFGFLRRIDFALVCAVAVALLFAAATSVPVKADSEGDDGSSLHSIGIPGGFARVKLSPAGPYQHGDRILVQPHVELAADSPVSSGAVRVSAFDSDYLLHANYQAGAVNRYEARTVKAIAGAHSLVAIFHHHNRSYELVVPLAVPHSSSSQSSST